MLFRNDGTGESNIIQNKFTKYLQTAVYRRKQEYLAERELQKEKEALVDYQMKQVWEAPEQDLMEGLDFIEQVENSLLLLALRQLKKRELEILLARALHEAEYEDLAKALGIGYKGASAIYYRTIEKLRKEMGGGEK